MNYTQKTIEEEELERRLLDEILNGEEPKDEERTLSNEEIERIYSELERGKEEIFKDLKEEPITDEEYREMEAGPYEPLYDPAVGQWTIAKEIEAFYGKDIYYRMIKELEKNMLTELHGKISKELYHEMKCLREGTKPKKKSDDKKKNSGTPKKKTDKEAVPQAKKESLQRKTKPGDEYFLKIRRGLIRNEMYREIFKGPSTVYEWLWSSIARKEWKDTEGYPIKANYYDKGLLACTSSISEIGKKCGGMSKATVAKYLDSFEKAGILKIEHLKPKGKKRGQSVFILGRWKNVDGEISESYYRDRVFLS